MVTGGVRFTHEELSTGAMLSVVASLTPYSDYNQSPRNMYQCQMGKQTMGTPVQVRLDCFDLQCRQQRSGHPAGLPTVQAHALESWQVLCTSWPSQTMCETCAACRRGSTGRTASCTGCTRRRRPSRAPATMASTPWTSSPAEPTPSLPCWPTQVAPACPAVRRKLCRHALGVLQYMH